MVKKDELTESPEIQGCISSVGRDFKGKIDDSGITMRFTHPGDQIVYTLHGRGRRKYARLVRFEKRTESAVPQCDRFGECGGCSGQHISYDEQFELLTGELKEKFKDLAGFALKAEKADNIYHYRNRMDFAVHPHGTGLHQAENFRRIIDIEDCKIQGERANQELAVFREFIRNNPGLPYDRRSEIGFLKYVTLRNADRLLTILTFIQDFETSDRLGEIAEAYKKVSVADDIVFCFNRKKSEVSADGTWQTVKGDGRFHATVAGRKFSVPFNSFFQPNIHEFEKIVSMIKSHLPARHEGTLVDMFCGSGFFSILFSDVFEEYYGVDVVLPAVERARHYFDENLSEKKYRFEAMDLFRADARLQFPSNSVLITDPPRAGLGERQSGLIVESGVEKVIYVSCNPWQQLEDLKILKKAYTIIDGMVCDPYPHTPHLESVVILEKKQIPLAG